MQPLTFASLESYIIGSCTLDSGLSSDLDHWLSCPYNIWENHLGSAAIQYIFLFTLSEQYLLFTWIYPMLIGLKNEHLIFLCFLLWKFNFKCNLMPFKLCVKVLYIHPRKMDMYTYINIYVYMYIYIYTCPLYMWHWRGGCGGSSNGISLFGVGLLDKIEDAQLNVNFRYKTMFFKTNNFWVDVYPMQNLGYTCIKKYF